MSRSFFCSSTNRSNSRDFHISDYYVTPTAPIEDFLMEFTKVSGVDINNCSILDPSAGGDENHDMSYPRAIHNLYGDSIVIDTIDIRNDSKADIKADYLTSRIDKKYDLVIINPPFSLAKEIIEKALTQVKDGGWVIMLLRLNYFGGLSREEFWNKHMAKYAFVHRKRLSFTGDKKTDSIEYMHCCWHKGEAPEFCELKII